MSDETPPITDAQRQQSEAEYHLALGRFVDAFARLENVIQLVLYRYAGVSMNAGRAVFSGARTAVIEGYLRRLAEVSTIPSDRWVILEPVLQQLRIISNRRNDILHYGAQAVGSGQGFVTNALTALTDSRRTIFPISPAILADMRRDCEKITLHLIGEHMGMPQLPAALPQEYQELLQAPWRYKPPPPSPGGETKAQTPPPRSPPQ